MFFDPNLNKGVGMAEKVRVELKPRTVLSFSEKDFKTEVQASPTVKDDHKSVLIMAIDVAQSGAGAHPRISERVWIEIRSLYEHIYIGSRKFYLKGGNGRLIMEMAK